MGYLQDCLWSNIQIMAISLQMKSAQHRWWTWISVPCTFRVSHLLLPQVQAAVSLILVRLPIQALL